MSKNKKIYTIYTPNDDITFIMEESYNGKEQLIALECKGFYFGEPDERSTRAFYNDYKAEFDPPL